MECWQLKPAYDLELPLCMRLRSPARESGLIETAGHLLWTSCSRFYLALFHRLQIVGRSHLPVRPPFILVSNHTSHLDVLVLSAPLRWRLRDQCFAVAAGDTFFSTPLLTAFAAGFLNALPMWRHRSGGRALSQLRTRLVDEPCVYILFPEGTRARNGKLAPFKAGLGMIVAGQDVPVVPCHIQGAFEAAQPACGWPKPSPIILRIGKPPFFKDVENTRRGWSWIVEQTEAAVRSLSQVAAASPTYLTHGVQL